MDGEDRRSPEPGEPHPRRAGELGLRPQVVVVILVMFLAFAGFAFWWSQRPDRSTGDRGIEACRTDGVGNLAISLDRPFPDPEPAVRAIKVAVESGRSPLEWERISSEPDRQTWIGRDGEGDLVVVADVVRGEEGWGPAVTKLCA